MNREANPTEQKVLKGMYMVQKGIAMAALGLMYLITLYFMVRTVYYGICEARGMDVGNSFRLYLGGFVMFAGISAVGSLVDFLIHKYRKRVLDFDPQAMELPAAGTVTLEEALRWMSPRIGVIVWDTIFILLLTILVFLMLFVGGNIPRILLICLVLAVLLVTGHFFFTWKWKRRSFCKKLLKNTRKYVKMVDEQKYAEAVDKSLRNGVLYYAKEMVLTEDYLIGLTETDVSFIPVAIPRCAVTEYTFYWKRPVMNRYRRLDMGILNCRLYGDKYVEFLIGQGPGMERVIKVFRYYQIPMREGELIYE